MCPQCTFSLLRGRVKYQAGKCLKQAQGLVKVFVACFVKVALKQAPLEIPEWAKRVPSTSNAKKGKFLTGQARNYCNGKGCSCVLHEVVRAFVPVEIIMSWLVAKIRFKVFLIY